MRVTRFLTCGLLYAVLGIASPARAVVEITTKDLGPDVVLTIAKEHVAKPITTLSTQTDGSRTSTTADRDGIEYRLTYAVREKQTLVWKRWSWWRPYLIEEVAPADRDHLLIVFLDFDNIYTQIVGVTEATTLPSYPSFPPKLFGISSGLRHFVTDVSVEGTLTDHSLRINLKTNDEHVVRYRFSGSLQKPSWERASDAPDWITQQEQTHPPTGNARNAAASSPVK